MKKIKLSALTFVSIFGIATALSIAPNYVEAATVSYGYNLDGSAATYQQYTALLSSANAEVYRYYCQGRISYNEYRQISNNMGSKGFVEGINGVMASLRNRLGVPTPSNYYSYYAPNPYVTNVKNTGIATINKWYNYGGMSKAKYNYFISEINSFTTSKEVNEFLAKLRPFYG